MFRQVLTPTIQNRTFTLPDEFLGKKTEVIAFSIPEESDFQQQSIQSKDILFTKFEGLTFNSKGTFKFSRDEANDYE